MTVIQVKFRKAVPPLDGVAEGGRGVGPAKAVALPTSQFPHNPHMDRFAPEGFEPIESIHEVFVTDAARWRDEDERGVDKPLPIISALLCGFALWSAGAFAWWAVT